MKPATVLRAAQLIRTGEVFELGRVLSASMPLPATRRFQVHTKRTNMNPESNRRGSNEEIVIAEIGQAQPLKIQGGTGSTVAPIAVR